MVKRLVVALLACLATGCAARTTAPEVTPNLVAIPSPIRVRLGTVQAPKDEYCAKTQALRDICVTDFEKALKNGLWKVLLARTTVVDRDGLSAEFRMIAFESTVVGEGSGPFPALAASSPGVVASPANTGPKVGLSMTWQFALRDAAGGPVMALNETTWAPTPVWIDDPLEPAVRALMQAVLERIGQALYAFNAAQPQPRASMPAPGCAPGTTRECTGTGVCRGVQACLPDGSGYEPCDCGTGTRM